MSTSTSSSTSTSGIDIARLLVQKIARTFYGSKGAILVDQLIQKEAYRDEELGKRLGMPSKDVTKIAHRLVTDQLVQVHRRSELKPGAPKASLRTYFYLDYSKCTDVIKWRMWKVQQTIDVKLRNELDAQGYVCPLCKAHYTPLDASTLYDPHRNLLACSICHTEVTNNENEEEVKGNKDRMQRLNRQTKGIVDLLKKLEKMELPRFDVEQYLLLHGPALGATAAAAALASGSGPSTISPQVKVHIAGDDDEEQEKRKREEELLEKRKQNLLPSWIAKSTIENNNNGGEGEDGNEEEVKVGGENGKGEEGERIRENTNNSNEGGGGGGGGVGSVSIGGFGAAMSFNDSKPQIDQQVPKSDDQMDDGALDAYYASLEAQGDGGGQEVEEEDGTPTISNGIDSPGYNLLAGQGGSVDSPAVSIGGGTGTDGEDFEIELENGNGNGNGKRSREEEEIDEARGGGESKKVRLDNGEIGSSEEGGIDQSRVDVSTAVEAGEAGEEEEEEEEDDEGEFDEVEESGDSDPNQLISVNGTMMPYSSVTEEMTGDMTADEYSAYWDVYQRVNA